MPKSMTRHVEIFYQDALDNIRHIKQQEWTATRDSLVAIAALTLVTPFWAQGRPWLIGAVWLVAVLNGVFLHSLARWIGRHESACALFTEITSTTTRSRR